MKKRWQKFLNENSDVQDYLVARGMDEQESYAYFQKITKQQNISKIDSVLSAFAFAVGVVPILLSSQNREEFYNDLLRQKEALARAVLKEEAQLFKTEQTLEDTFDQADINKGAQGKNATPSKTRSITSKHTP